MYKYEIIIFWSNDDQCYVTEVPELPGCMSDGATLQEAVENTQVIISEWIEVAKATNREIPVPKGRLIYA